MRYGQNQHVSLLGEFGCTYASDQTGRSSMSFAYWDPDSDTVWIAYEDGGTVDVIEYRTQRKRATLQLRANWIAGTAKGTILIADTAGNQIVELDQAHRQIGRWTCRAPVSVQECYGGAKLLVAESGPAGVCLLSRDGLREWEWAPGSQTLRTPGSAALWREGIIVADQYRHVLTYIGFDKSASVLYGVPATADNRRGFLCVPHSAMPLTEDRLLVCDSLNGRVMDLSLAEGILWQHGDADHYGAGPDRLWCPRVAQPLPGGRVLICDSKNNRALVVDRQNRVEWEYGAPIVTNFRFKLPRSVQRYEDSLCVADTFHHRVVGLDLAGTELWQFGDGTRGDSDGQLAFPRCAHRYAGGLLIADSKNHRVLLVDRDRRVARTYDRLTCHGNTVVLQDPHDIAAIGPDRFLLVDSGLNAVLMFDSTGEITWSYWRLRDPHQAIVTAHQSVIVADTGNNRIVEIDRAGHEIASYESAGPFRFNRPRYVGRVEGEDLIIDTYNRRILVVPHGEGSPSEISHIPSALPHLSSTRWLHATGSQLFVSDTGNNRILHLSRARNPVTGGS